jgi:hypothetical protein
MWGEQHEGAIEGCDVVAKPGRVTGCPWKPYDGRGERHQLTQDRVVLGGIIWIEWPR